MRTKFMSKAEINLMNIGLRVLGLCGAFAYLTLNMAFAEASKSYQGSSFAQIREILQDAHLAPEDASDRAEWDVYRAGALPHYTVNSSHFVKAGIDLLINAAKRTTNDRSDFYPRITKLLHPNGICFTGVWKILNPSPYTGYFEKGKSGLFVGRSSVAMTETEVGHKRGFGFAGKLFPTQNPYEVVNTANFFSVDVLLGTKARHYTDVAMTNEPSTGFDLSAIFLALKIASALKHGDHDIGFRPLYPIAELGLASGERAKTPKWIKIQADELTRKVDASDFRDELDIRRNYPEGLKMIISVSDETKDADETEKWLPIGEIELNESVISYGCDRQLHFSHPKIR